MVNQQVNPDGQRSFGLHRWKHSAAVRWVLLLLFVLLFYLSLAPHLLPKTYDIEMGKTSERDIEAPTQIMDEKATLQAQEACSRTC